MLYAVWLRTALTEEFLHSGYSVFTQVYIPFHMKSLFIYDSVFKGPVHILITSPFCQHPHSPFQMIIWMHMNQRHTPLPPVLVKGIL